MLKNKLPRATKEMAVTAGLSPITHPKSVANSPTMAVTIPMKAREIEKEYHPPPYLAGGTRENRSFHPTDAK